MVARSMKIAFVGQPGFSERTQALATALAEREHMVNVFVGRKSAPQGMQRFQVVRLHTSWTSWTTLLRISVTQPEAVHVSGWNWVGKLLWLRFFLPETMIVWTLEELPKNWNGWNVFLARQAINAADSVTVTTRARQWELLTATGIRAAYIPNGFSLENQSLPSIRRWKLWKGRYGVTTARTKKELKWVAEAWKVSKTQKKLVVIGAVSLALQPLFKRKYPFLMFREGGSRVRQALFTGAHLVVTCSASDDSSLLLSAMASGRPIISTTRALNEELFGTTTEFVREGDEKSLAGLITRLSRSASAKTSLAAVRAQKFFRWERIFLDYLPLYVQIKELVLLDSARSVTFTKPAVQ